MKLDKYQLLHRLTGFSVVIFVLLLAVTGIFINHSDQLGLDNKYIKSDWLLDWYDIGPAVPPVSYRSGNDWISIIDSRIYFNDREIQAHGEFLSGMVEAGNLYVVAFHDFLLLLSKEGRIIEKISGADGIPGTIMNIGRVNNDTFIIATETGNYINGADIGNWQQKPVMTSEWSTPDKLPPAYMDKIMALYRGRGLSIERVLLDIHSGRFIGKWSIVILDIIAVLIIFSAISGMWMWYKKKKLLAELE